MSGSSRVSLSWRLKHAEWWFTPTEAAGKHSPWLIGRREQPQLKKTWACCTWVLVVAYVTAPPAGCTTRNAPGPPSVLLNGHQGATASASECDSVRWWENELLWPQRTVSSSVYRLSRWFQLFFTKTWRSFYERTKIKQPHLTPLCPPVLIWSLPAPKTRRQQPIKANSRPRVHQSPNRAT